MKHSTLFGVLGVFCVGALGQNVRMGFDLPLIAREEFAERLAVCTPEGLSRDQVGLLHLHYVELCRWNRRVSLVGPIARGEVVERHYGESLEGLRFIDPTGGELLDLGSGAGFPGFVLAVARPQVRVTLVEARERKWSFLESVCRKAGLSSRCLNARVDSTPIKELPKEIDWITARAVAVKDLGLTVLLPKLTPRGVLLLWGGAQEPDLPSELRVCREVHLAGARFRRILEIARKPAGSEA